MQDLDRETQTETDRDVFFVDVGKLKQISTHPMEQILTMEEKRVVSLCRPSEFPAFMLATICTPSSPTNSRFES